MGGDVVRTAVGHAVVGLVVGQVMPCRVHPPVKK
jgi:hypothetical protein